MSDKILKPLGFETDLTNPVTLNSRLLRIYNPTGAVSVISIARNTSGTANLVSGSAVLEGTGTSFATEFVNGDAVVLMSNNDGFNQKAIINVVANNDYMNLTTTLTYSNTAGVIQKVYANCTILAAGDQLIKKESNETISATHNALGCAVAYTN